MKLYFPNLCTSEISDEIIAKNNKIMSNELTLAGIPIEVFPFLRKDREVKATLIGSLLVGNKPRWTWSFDRAWRYWTAEGPAVPYEVAKIIYESEHRDDCTACGSSFNPDGMGGFGVDSYHIFTDDALKFLVEQLNAVAEKHRDRLNGDLES